MSKRTLSESSTGSEGDPENHSGINGAPYFKIPRQDSSAPTSPIFRPRNPAYFPQEYGDANNSRQLGPSISQPPKYERRESQASTTSTTTSRSSMSETDEDDADAQKLSTVSN
jgi:hypothetical protein